MRAPTRRTSTRPLHGVRSVALALAVVAILGGPAADPTGALPLRDDAYVRPVPGAVLRPFSPPEHAFGPGHRGVDLAAGVGEPVRAAAGGSVLFAGRAADSRWVTIDHAGAVRTTYGPLDEVHVQAGDRIGRGVVIGTVGGPPHHGRVSALHWGARRDGTYIDPLELLVPRRPTLVGAGSWHVGGLPDVPYEPWDGRQRWGVVPSSRRAHGPGWSLPPNVNRVIGIAGLGSRTGEPPFDLTHLGYPSGDVGYLSYARDGGAYAPEDTWRGVDAAARRLKADLRAAWEADPGRAVDLVGHSMGGVVAMHYLLHHHDPLDPGLPPIGNVVTVASPLGGADLARALVDAADDPVGRKVLETVGRLVDDHDPTSPAISDLAAGGKLTTDLEAAWAAAVRAPHTSPLATGTRVLTLGGQFDVVVPEHRSDLEGAPHAVLPGGHDGVRRTEAVRIVVREFLAGRPVPAEAGGVGHWLSHPLGWFERLLVDNLVPG